MIKRKILSSVTSMLAVILLILFLIFEEESSAAVVSALTLCALRVIPALFPYMVISSVIVSLDLLGPICCYIPTERIFALPCGSASVILTGLLCGFPVGAAGACRLYESGKLTKNEAERLIVFSSGASPAFLCGTVASLWDSKKYGIFLLISQTVLSLICGMLLSKIGNKDINVGHNKENVKEKVSFPAALCKAVSDAASASLSLTAYVTFFRVISVIASAVLPYIYLPMSAVAEFSFGCVSGASIGGYTGAFICGFAIGFSGLSVFMQIYNITAKSFLDIKYYLPVKTLCGIILGFLSCLFFKVAPMNTACKTSTAFNAIPLGHIIVLYAILFFICALAHMQRKDRTLRTPALTVGKNKKMTP